MSLTDLPDLILSKIFEFCAEDIQDIHNLRETCSYVCHFIDRSWDQLYTNSVLLNNFNTISGTCIFKPVLNLKLDIFEENFHLNDYDVTYVETFSVSDIEEYDIVEDNDGKRLPLIIKPKEEAHIFQLEKALDEINLINLQSLDICFKGINCFKYPYHSLLRSRTLGSTYLKKLKVKINFLCSYCSEFVANIQEKYSNLNCLEIENIQSDNHNAEIMVCLSLPIFERFQRDIQKRKTIVKRISVHVLSLLEESNPDNLLLYLVVPESAHFVSLVFQ